MKCRLICGLAVLLSAAAIHADALKTGSQIRQLPSKTYLNNTHKSLNEFLDQKFVVLHIWEMNSAALQEFYLISNLAVKHKDDANFIGIGLGSAEKLKRFPGAERLGFPVNADPRGGAKKLFARTGDSLPMTVILDRSGTILWRGKTKQLSRILKECAAGKYNLSEQIRKEEFARTLQEVVRNEEFDKAIKLLQDEYRNNPQRLDLLNSQIALLKKLGRSEEIFQTLHAAQQNRPQDYRIFEIEYQYIGETSMLDRLPDFFSRIKKNFAGRPDILIAFANAECKLPPDKLNLEYACDLAAAGWNSPNFADDNQRGLYALDYANILHNIGRNDLALALAEAACGFLKNDPKNLPTAVTAKTYYSKLHKIAPTIKLPDLKK